MVKVHGSGGSVLCKTSERWRLDGDGGQGQLETFGRELLRELSPALGASGPQQLFRIEDHYSILAGDWGVGQGTTVFDFSERAGIDLPIFSKWPEAEKKVAEYIALFPNVLLGLQVDHFYAVVLLPVAVDLSLIHI